MRFRLSKSKRAWNPLKKKSQEEDVDPSVAKPDFLEPTDFDGFI
jgi:hypothetical protein